MPNGYKFYDSQYPNPLKNTISDGGEGLPEFYEGVPQDVTPIIKSFYVFCATPEEILAIRSSLEVGSPIAYPDTYSPIIEIIEQAFQFPNAIPEGSCMDICELMIDCINNDDDVRNAILQAVNNGLPADSSSGANETIAGTNILAGVTCDDDNLFGAITGLVDLMNDLAEDVLEKLAESQNKISKIGDMLEAIPGVGVLPFDDILQMIDTFFDDMQDAYVANYDTTIRDNYRCDLFCVAKDADCAIDFQDVFDYFLGELGESITTANFLTFVTDLVTQNYSGVYVVHAWHTLMSGLMLFGQSVFGIDSDRLIKMVQALFNDPDSDWSTVCDECVETFEHVFDFTVDNGGWTARNIWGTGNCALYDSGHGWTTQDRYNGASEYSRLIAIEIPVVPDTEITNVEMVYNCSDVTYSGSLSSMTGLTITKLLDSTLVDSYTEELSAVESGLGILRGDPDDATADYIRLFLRCSDFTSAIYQNNAHIVSCTVRGIGSDPF